MSATDAMPAYLTAVPTMQLQRELASISAWRHIAADADETVLYRFGASHAPRVVLLPPSGMSVLLISRLARVLSHEYCVLSWESRGCPNLDVAMTSADAELDAQAAELAGIVRAQGWDDFHFVGWCQAPQKVLQAMHAHGVSPRSLAFLAPAGLGYSVVASEFERCALPIYLQIAAKDVQYAQRVGRILDTCGQTSSAEQLAERLSLLHLASPEATYRFSIYMRSFEASKAHARSVLGAALATTRTLLVHCKDDTFSHYSESVQLARAHPSVELQLLASGGHLLMFKQPEAVGSLLRSFFMGGEVSAATASPARITASAEIMP